MIVEKLVCVVVECEHNFCADCEACAFAGKEGNAVKGMNSTKGLD